VTATRILIADDHAVVRAGLRHILEREPDFELVGEAADGDEAVRLALDLLPDVLVLDIGMPGRNGLEVARELLAHVPGIHIVILTVYDDHEYFRQLVEIGVAGYVLKAAADSALVDAIRAAQRGGALVDGTLMRSLMDLFVHRTPSATTEERKCSESTPALSAREEQVLKLTALGYSGQQIADQLGVGVSTVETHRTHLMRKLGLKGRAQIVQYAIHHGYMEPTAR